MMIDFETWGKIKGFMHEDEALRLYDIALEASKNGPVVEIGSYCGKSAYIIGTACRKNNSVLYSIDHHRGSEEQQKGEQYFDPDLYDPILERVNTLSFFQQTLCRTRLEDTVIPVVASSRAAGKFWDTKIAMLFIDGGHSFEAAHHDYLTWTKHIQPAGFLVIHDIFFDPQKGGLAPGQVYEIACKSENFHILEMTNTLGVLKRK